MDAKDRILEHIRQKGLERAFTAKDLTSVAPRGTIDVTLSRLFREGTIRRIGRGLYDFPRQSELLGQPVPPDIDQAAQAVARKHRWTITPEGAAAANTLGISQQVPAKIVYLSDGPSREITVGRRKIWFRHASPKDLKMPHYSSRLITQALRFLGKKNVAAEVVDRLRRLIPAEDRAMFLEDTRYGTGWIHDVAKHLREG